jgi:hypothetical protein
MRKLKVLRIALIPLLLIVLCWLLREEPWILVKRLDLDLNSGDLRYRVCVCFLPVRSEIRESSLSREVRRLDLATPRSRAWRPAFVQRHEPTHADYWYGHFITGIFDPLVRLLDEARVPDEERRMILGQFMKSLQLRHALDAQDEGHSLMATVRERYGQWKPETSAEPREEAGASI